MAETPADLADSRVEGIEAATASDDVQWSLPARRWVVPIALALGFVLALLDTLGVQAFGMPGVLTALGLVAIAGAVLYGLSGSNSESLSRSPLVAADALTALPDPCYVTDRRGAVLFANEAYRLLSGGFDNDRPVPVERLLSGRGEGAEASFR
ncbi:MAG: hypothetical protein ABJ325_08750, partial [Nitratireductor sp.]